ncbi:PREDICTED: peptidoglycan recognition protein 3-like [Eufriesea mexicana]|uniref:peptidoglycan recognition protein 3-like n=1 Tax=Eufriesea mexicana TaxID=516756 RepID=UPI00083BDC4A|nr:PREDICTED: peptidoglycan recognition protein 3-like [Eufriesea mexicana]
MKSPIFFILIFYGLTLLVPIENVDGVPLSWGNFKNDSVIPNIVSRKEWGARPPVEQVLLEVTPTPYVVIHHGGIAKYCYDKAACSEIVRSYQNYHLDGQGWFDIGYNFVIGEDGNVYEGRGWNYVGAHAPGYNTQSIGICIIGDFSDFLPSEVALKAVNTLVDYGVSLGKISEDYRIIGHRQVRNTVCPGEVLYRYLQTHLRWTCCPVPRNAAKFSMIAEYANNGTYFMQKSVKSYMKLFLFLLLVSCQELFCAVHQTPVRPNIISRSQWGAKAPKSTIRNLAVDPPPFIIIHHSATDGCTTQAICQARIRSFQNHHMNENNWADIGYQFLVGEDGNIYEGRGWGKHGAHSTPYNSKSIGICMIGNFVGHNPNEAAIKAVKDLITYGVAIGKIQENYKLLGHRQVSQTSCPGDNLYNLIKTWPNWTSIE